jgi:hypothetical protein
MRALGWVIAAGLLAAIIIIAVLYRQAATRRARAQAILSRAEEEQNRMLQGLILAQEAASRILTPGELTGTISSVLPTATMRLWGSHGAGSPNASSLRVHPSRSIRT